MRRRAAEHESGRLARPASHLERTHCPMTTLVNASLGLSASNLLACLSVCVLQCCNGLLMPWLALARPMHTLPPRVRQGRQTFEHSYKQQPPAGASRASCHA